jgi:DNA mismatch repair protein MutS
MVMIDNYLDLHKKYILIYGEENTVVLSQIGGFYECYAILTEGPNLKKLSNILGCAVTRKDKSIIEISRKNHYLIGFPVFSLEKHIKKLLDANYTVILNEQVTEAPNPVREVTKILSPGTSLTQQLLDPNYVCSIYIEQFNCLKTYSKILSIGISIIDISTGYSEIYERDINTKELNLIFNYINLYSVKEIILNYKDVDEEIRNNFEDQLYILNRIIYKEKFIKNEYLKLAYQETLLNKIFKNNNSLLSIIEYLNIEYLSYGRLSYIILLQFCYEHQEKILNKINKPIIYNGSEIMELNNNAIYQLDIINTNEKSLFNIINQTSTAMGGRLLKYNLLHPIINEEILNKKYDIIELLIKNDLYKKYEKHLQNILDIQRINRKMELNVLHPFEFSKNLNNSNIEIQELLKKCEENKLYEKFDITKEIVKELEDYINEYTDCFDLELMNKYSIDNISSNFFKKGIYKELDDIQINIDNIYIYFNDEIEKLSKLIDKENWKGMVKLEKNERDGYFLICTKKRSELLKKNLKDNTYNIKNKSGTLNKITSEELSKKSDKILLYQSKIQNITKKLYIEKLSYLSNKYSITMKLIGNIIANIDVYISSSKIAIKNAYTKPIIKKVNESSYIKAKKLRHNIVEKINENIEYVSNDVELNSNGILLFGLNAAGKSTLMKSIGLNVILAQAGQYVASSEFIYNPYKSIYTRISGNDNIFKGQSSFVVEMTELRTILEFADKNSLVIGDEISKGTESISGLSIVASSINKLIKKETSFIFATHLHKLIELDIINNNEKIRLLHLSVLFNNDNDTIIYNRKLTEGAGPELYGLEVAKYIINDKEFIDLAYNIRNKITKRSKEIINPKQSKYNTNLYMDNCNICNKTHKEIQLDTHHINYQKDADCNGIIKDKYFHKNNKFNLVILCKQCHMDVHSNKILLKGWIFTTNGTILNYETIKKSDKIEENNELIKSYKNKKMSKKIIIQELEKKHNIHITLYRLNKILNN